MNPMYTLVTGMSVDNGLEPMDIIKVIKTYDTLKNNI
jgi:hypothetical protein